MLLSQHLSSSDHHFFSNWQARPDLVQLALRTLEYWVDTLNPEYLEPAMADVMPRLMHALWAHLRPQPYPFGPKVPPCACPVPNPSLPANLSSRPLPFGLCAFAAEEPTYQAAPSRVLLHALLLP